MNYVASVLSEQPTSELPVHLKVISNIITNDTVLLAGVEPLPANVPLGCSYDPIKQKASFAVVVSQEVAAVVLMTCPAQGGESEVIEQTHMQPYCKDGAGCFAISLAGVEPGTRYAYKLISHGGDLLSAHCADPYALAETKFEWNHEPGKFIDRVKSALQALRGENDTEQDALQKAFGSERQRFLALLGGGPTIEDYRAPWSIVIDRSQLLSDEEMSIERPHAPGERVICKYHPLHSAGVDDRFISPESHHLRGKLELLLDPTFRNYLKGFWNTIEFFPLNSTVPCAELAAIGRAPVWGYMPSNFFALNTDYFHTKDPHKQIQILQQIVNELKKDGFDVVFDLVPFHNVEKADTGPRYSLRALDEKRYYLLDDNGDDVDVSGCGNTLNIHSREVQNLILSQAKHFSRVYGGTTRFDQAAIAHLPEHRTNGYDDNAHFANQLYSLGECIVEGGHAQGLYFRDAAALRSIPGVSYKNFEERNLGDMLALGLKADPFNGETYVSSRAFSRAGYIGGGHAEQRRRPLFQNRGVSVFPHDGMTPYDRAEIFSLISLAKAMPDIKMKELADNLRKVKGDRAPQVHELLEYARKNFPRELRAAQANSARFLMANQYLTPGDILTVFGDQNCRTQNGNGNAFDRIDYLLNANALSNDPVRLHNQQMMSLFVNRLMNIRNQYAHVYSNTNLFDGVSESSSAPGVVTSLRWFDKRGEEIHGDHQVWRNGRGSTVRGFTGVLYHSRKQTDGGSVPFSDLYVVESHLPRSIRLPELAPGYQWRLLADSSQPADPVGQRIAARSTYSISNPGVLVFESVKIEARRA